MKQLLFLMSNTFEAIPDQVRRFRWLVWSLFIGILIFYGSGASKFQLDLTDEGFFSKSDPVRIAYNQFRAQFGGDDNIYLVYKALDGDVFSEKSLTAVRNLQEEILNYRLHLAPEESSPLDHIVDVKTIVNASYLEASDDALVSRQFIGSNIPRTQEELNAIREKAFAHPDYPLFYVSKDASYGGILIRTDLGAKPVSKNSDDPEEKNADGSITELTLDDLEITDFDELQEDFQQNTATAIDENPEFEFVDPVQYQDLMHKLTDYFEKPEYQAALNFHPVGNAVIHTYVLDVLFEQINTVMGLSILLIIAMLWILFRSAAAVLWPIIIIGSASVMAIATLGWLELRMNMMVNITIFMILVVGVADSVHLLSGYIYYRNHGHDHRKALRLTYRNAGMAILLTSVTTAIGMMSLFLVPIDAIQIFGFSAAAGVVFAFIISVLMLPLMLDIWKPYKENRQKTKAKEHHVIQRVLRKVEHYSHLKPDVNISIFTIIFIFFLYGLTLIEVDSNPMSLFKPDTPIVKDFSLVDKNMSGTQNIELMIDMGVENALKDPAVLKAMEEYQNYLVQTFPGEVLRTNSLVNIAKDANKSLNGGKETFYTIPDNPQILEQTLFLFNSANPTDRRLVVSDDYRQAHVTASFTNVGSKRYVEILDQVQPQLDNFFGELKNVYPAMKITTTGSMTIFSKLLDLLSWSQIKGFGIALALISVILLLVLSSVKLGLIALYPNLFPLVVMFGLMGYLKIPLDVDTLIVAPLMIGIVVDDTIHFLNHYRAEVQKHGDVYKGIKIAFREVGQAIAFTSIILALSFMAMMLMDHQGLKHFGILSSITIVTALIAELFLLPALLVRFGANLGVKNQKQSTKTNYEQADNINGENNNEKFA